MLLSCLQSKEDAVVYFTAISPSIMIPQAGAHYAQSAEYDIIKWQSMYYTSTDTPPLKDFCSLYFLNSICHVQSGSYCQAGVFLIKGVLLKSSKSNQITQFTNSQSALMQRSKISFLLPLSFCSIPFSKPFKCEFLAGLWARINPFVFQGWLYFCFLMGLWKFARVCAAKKKRASWQIGESCYTPELLREHVCVDVPGCYMKRIKDMAQPPWICRYSFCLSKHLACFWPCESFILLISQSTTWKLCLI